VHEKVASAHPKTDHAATPSAAALTGLLADLPSFTGQNSFHSGPIDRNLCLVQYFEGAKQVGRRRSHNWWTSCQQAQHLSTIDAVRMHLALLPDWGDRDRRQFAFLPRGTRVTYIVGRAAPQLSKLTHRQYEG